MQKLIAMTIGHTGRDAVMLLAGPTSEAVPLL